MKPTLKKMLTGLGVEEQRLLPDATLEDAGIDSLVLVELAMVLKGSGTDIGEDELADAQTVADLDRLVTQRLPQR